MNKPSEHMKDKQTVHKNYAQRETNVDTPKGRVYNFFCKYFKYYQTVQYEIIFFRPLEIMA